MKHWKQHIGIVGTEARINQEELVKSRRKIWSIPIAALALVLMLAGALAVSGIVQAQASNIVEGGGDVVLGTVIENTTITTIMVEAADADQDPVVRGVADDEAIVAVTISGADARLFEIAGVTIGTGVVNGLSAQSAGTRFEGIVSPRTAYDHDGDANTPNLDPAAIIIDEETKAVFTFDVVVWFDTNTAVDSGKGYRAPVDAGDTAPVDTPDVAGGDGALDRVEDRDASQTVRVTLYIPKVVKDAPVVDDDAPLNVDDDGNDVFFAAIPGMASQDDVIYGTSGQSKTTRAGWTLQSTRRCSW